MPDQIAKAMPDPMAKWTPTPDWAAVKIIRADWSAKPVLGLSMALVVGNIAAAISALAPHLSEVGLWQVASASDHVIRIGRDKALIVTSAPIPFETGWNAGGFSATDASSASGVIEIAGQALPDIIAEATAADFDAGSRSASLLFAGVACLVMRTAPDTARLTIEIGHMTYLWRWLETRTERK
jgi:heterotetrameric sarcosine oxidase gamma subunit